MFVCEDYQLKLMDEDSERKEALKRRSMVERRFGVGKRWQGLGGHATGGKQR